MSPRKSTQKTFSSDLVASSLLERILKGEWQVGDKIPSVDQLEKVLPVSRVTIAKGIRKLCRQGYLRSAWRSGTYVQSDCLVRRILLHVGGDPVAVQVYPFSLVMTRKLEKLLAERGMQVEIHWEARQPLVGSRLGADLQDNYFEGIVSVQSNLPRMIKQHLPSLRGRLPTVHIGIHHSCPWVFVDMAAFTRYALQRCHSLDVRRVLYFSQADSAEFNRFVPGAEMTVHTLQPESDSFPEDPSENSAFSLFLKAWKRLKGNIDAVIVPDDIVAKGVTQAVLSLGPLVADRLRIIALTNKDSGLFFPLPIEPIEVDSDEIAHQAIKLLMDQFDHGVQLENPGIAIAPHPKKQMHPNMTI